MRECNNALPRVFGAQNSDNLVGTHVYPLSLDVDEYASIVISFGSIDLYPDPEADKFGILPDGQ